MLQDLFECALVEAWSVPSDLERTQLSTVSSIINGCNSYESVSAFC